MTSLIPRGKQRMANENPNVPRDFAQSNGKAEFFTDLIKDKTILSYHQFNAEKKFFYNFLPIPVTF